MDSAFVTTTISTVRRVDRMPSHREGDLSEVEAKKSAAQVRQLDPPRLLVSARRPREPGDNGETIRTRCNALAGRLVSVRSRSRKGVRLGSASRSPTHVMLAPDLRDVLEGGSWAFSAAIETGLNSRGVTVEPPRDEGRDRELQTRIVVRFAIAGVVFRRGSR